MIGELMRLREQLRSGTYVEKCVKSKLTLSNSYLTTRILKLQHINHMEQPSILRLLTFNSSEPFEISLDRKWELRNRICTTKSDKDIKLTNTQWSQLPSSAHHSERALTVFHMQLDPQQTMKRNSRVDSVKFSP